MRPMGGNMFLSAATQRREDTLMVCCAQRISRKSNVHLNSTCINPTDLPGNI